MAGPWEKYQQTASEEQAPRKPWEAYAVSGPEPVEAQPVEQPGGGFMDMLFENIMGRGEADTPGEKLGGLINQMGAGAIRGAAGLLDLAGTGGAPRVEATMGQAPSGAPQPQVTGVTPIAPASQAVEPSLPQPQTTADQYANTVGQFIPGALAGGGGTLGGLLRYGVAPGLASEAAGQMTAGTTAEPYARMGAAMVAPLAASGLETAVRRAITPAPADPARLSLASTLKQEGVPVTAGQKVGSERIRRIEGMTGAGQRVSGDQAEAFTSAAMKKIGSNSARATPEALSEAAKRIGGVMDDAVSGVDVVPDRASITRLASANETYKQLAPRNMQAPIVGNILSEMAKTFRSGGSIPAKTVSAWRSSLSKLTKSSDTATREAAIEALEAVDDTLAASLTNAGKADAVARLSTARQQYRDLLAIQGAASRAGEGATIGLISPSALRNEVVKQGRASYAQGRRGDLADLARAGEGVIKPLPTSGTAENLRALSVPMAAGGGAGAYLANSMGIPAEAGMIAGALAPQAARGLMMTPPVQRYLGNQLIPGQSAPLSLSGLLAPVATAQGIR